MITNEKYLMNFDAKARNYRYAEPEFMKVQRKGVIF